MGKGRWELYVVPALMVKLETHLTFAHEAMPNEIKADGLLYPLLLPKQDPQAERRHQSVAQKHLADPFTRFAVPDGCVNLGIIDPAPLPSDLPDARALSTLPHESVHEALPGDDARKIEKLREPEVSPGDAPLPGGTRGCSRLPATVHAPRR